MNMIKYILATLSLLLIIGACSDEKLIYNPANVAPGQLGNINSSYVLDATKASDVAQVFNWGVFDMGYKAIVTYTLQMDLAGNNFTNAVDLASGNILSASITVAQLNAAMIKLQKVYSFADETAQSVEFRVKGSISSSVDPFYTNVVSAQITPYSADVEYAKVYVVGAFNAWTHPQDQFLWAFTGGSVYEGWIGFDGQAQNGWKITGVPAWDDANGNWGAASDSGQTAEASTMTLINGSESKNITAYSKNFYKFSYNTSTLELDVLNSMNTFSIVGDALGDPNWNTDVLFDFDTQNQVFVATATFVDGSIKFRADKAWSLSFGQGATPGVLVAGDAGQNIPVSAGTYKVTVNLNNSANMTYKIEAGTALDPNKITAPVLNTHGDLALDQNKSDAITWTALDFQGQSPATVSYTVEMALAGTNFANVQTLGATKDVTLTVSGDTYLTALKALGKDIDQASDVDVRVTATVSGISNTFTSNVVSYNLTIQTPPEFPADLYMTGDEFGSWFSDQSGVIHMVPVNGIPGSFWCIKYFHAGKGFKWAPQPSWDGGDFAQLDNGATGYSVTTDGNAFVAEDGLYMVYIDMSAKAVTMEPAKIYGIGDCFGSWDAGTYPFAVSDSKATITTTAAGDVRMYAGSSAPTATTDWWRMEFIVLDGNIVYRGNGDDQERVSVNAGQTVTLDFSNDTGTIQ